MADSAGVRYDKFSLSLPVVAVVILFEFICICFSIFGSHNIGLFIVEVAGFILLLNFYCIRIVLDDEVILVSYGLGIFRKALDIHSITSASVVENEGFVAWIFNPWATHAVKLSTRDGGRVTIATDDSTRILEIVSGSVR